MDLRLLGPTEVLIAGHRPALGGPRQRAVLADLALNAGHTLVIGRLVDDLWGEDPPATATHTVKVYVSRLRQILESSGEDRVLVTRGPGYRLDVSPGQIDAFLFADLSARGQAALKTGQAEQARQLLSRAIELWRGPALADIQGAEFATAAAGRLENDRLDALEALVDARLSLGHHRDLISDLESAVASNPFRERFHAQLMLALYRSGRQAEALAAFLRARLVLARDLGIEPGPELRDLETSILRQAPGLRPDDRQTARMTPARAMPLLALPTTAKPDGLSPTPSSPTTGTRPRSARSRQPRARRMAVAMLLVVGLVIGVTSVLRLPSRPMGQAAQGLSAITAAGHLISGGLHLPGEPGSSVTADGSLWVTSPEAHALYRVNPKSGSHQTIPVGAGAGALAASGSDIWVANALDDTISRVNSQNDEVVQTVPVGAAPTGLAVGGGVIWVANSTGRSVSGVDAATGGLRSTRSLSFTPGDVAFGAGSLWLTNPNGDTVTRLAPVGGPELQIPVGAGPSAISYASGALWVTNGLDSSVSRISPATDATVATISVGNSPDALTITGQSVWVANRLSSTVTLLNSATDEVTRSVKMRAAPVALTTFGRDVWAATRPSLAPNSSTGTLHVVLSQAPTSIDPAAVYPHVPTQLFAGTYDGLVSYERVGGAAGLQLVPNLALAMPTISGGGTGYSFVLRTGLRYSDGTTVRPADIRYGLERLLARNPSAASFFSGVLGAGACRNEKPCDLVHGVALSGDTITFHLTAPDPDFLAKLAVVGSPPVPATQPEADVGTRPVPSTGPYMIARYVPGHELDFVRNPYFREWSAAAEPPGSPAGITWTFGATVTTEVAEIKTGRADWTFDYIPNLATLYAELPDQIHVNPNFTIDYAAFNTRVSPFNHASVRRAFSLAADRAELVRQLGGATAAAPTCQILPPGIPGYQPYCPFTADPNPAGTWVGPDLAKARNLVAKSGTLGTRVTIWAQPYDETTGAFMVSVLRELGYRASKVTPSPTVMARDLNDSRARVQATDGIWGADFPSPSDFLDLFFRCDSFKLADPGATRNGDFFCDPAIDRQMNAADAEGTTNLALAESTWAIVDREVTYAAPWVPLATLNWPDFLSKRVSNYQYNPASGVLLDQLVIRSAS